ncbi:MAG: UDP-N-acetylmuramoyl-L-alanyl-D-glutamate--2,6-diaminopimelate ligase, partial [Patescibacteria group bacterium]|nr:UDP-N-acetylmuramoyl-L-alanyl-D-glutamate--2,6-diaminopimelate ligase [Patescibacteria group bacterium]
MWQGIKNIYHLFVAVLANCWYGFPGRKLTIVGVTGTDGKTTTSSLVYHILKENNYPVSLISTVSALIHGKESDTGFHVTNPAPFALQRFIAQAVAKKDAFLVLEVTSHGLDQNRVWGVPFTIGVLTNVSHEHLDYHKT